MYKRQQLGVWGWGSVFMYVCVQVCSYVCIYSCLHVSAYADGDQRSPEVCFLRS